MLPCPPTLSAGVSGSAELLALTVQPAFLPVCLCHPGILSWKPFCLHVPHSASGIFFILQDPVHKLTSLESLPDSLWEAQHCPLELVILQAPCASLGTLIPSDLRLFVGQFPHESISF